MVQVKIFFHFTFQTIFTVLSRLSKTTREQPDMMKRYLWFCILCGLQTVRIWIYAFFGVTFSIVPQEYQWILAVLSPLVREALTILTIKTSQKASGEDSYDKFSTKYANIHYIETTHAIFLAIIIGGVATQASTYCIIGIDFLMNIYNGLKVVKMHKNRKDSKFLFLLLIPIKILTSDII